MIVLLHVQSAMHSTAAVYSLQGLHRPFYSSGPLVQRKHQVQLVDARVRSSSQPVLSGGVEGY